MTLRDILAYLERNAAEDDTWFVKVSGPIVGFRNTLIPSTLAALTNDTYRGHNGGRRLRSENVKLLGAKRSAHAGVRATIGRARRSSPTKSGRGSSRTPRP